MSNSAAPAPVRPGGKGLLFIVSAPSGTGKTTIVERLVQRVPNLGTSAADTDAALAQGEDVVLVIDVQGARQVRSRGCDAVSIFVLPPSAAILEQRLRGRSKDSDEQIRRRLAVARVEVNEYSQYDYLIVNDELETAVGRLEAIVIAERARTQRMRPTAEAIIGTFA